MLKEIIGSGVASVFAISGIIAVATQLKETSATQLQLKEEKGC